MAQNHMLKFGYDKLPPVVSVPEAHEKSLTVSPEVKKDTESQVVRPTSKLSPKQMYHYENYKELKQKAKVRLSSGPAPSIGNKDWEMANEKK
jgi:hypothetical protein